MKNMIKQRSCDIVIERPKSVLKMLKASLTIRFHNIQKNNDGWTMFH